MTDAKPATADPFVPPRPDVTEHGFFPSEDVNESAQQHEETFGDIPPGIKVEKALDGTVLYKDKLSEAHVAGKSAATEFEIEARRIAKDADLSDQGKAKAIARKATEAAASLSESDTLVAQAEAERDRLAERLRRDIEADEPEVVDALLAMERRTALLKMEPRARSEVIEQAIADGDLDTLRAVTSVPRYVVELTDFMYDRAKTALAAATHGRQIEALRSYDGRTRAARESIDTAKRYLRQNSTPEALAEAGVPGRDIRSMTDEQKSAYIAEHGLAAFRDLVHGQ